MLKGLLKGEALQAFTECRAFDEHIKEKQKELDVRVNDCISKHPSHEQYFLSIMQNDDVKTANSELSMLHDAVKCMEMKLELMTDNVKENGNLLSVLRSAL